MSQTQPKPQTQSQSQGRVKPNSIVYWLRVILAIAAGILNRFMMFAKMELDVTSNTYTTNSFLFGEAVSGEVALVVGIAVGLALYVISILIVRYLLRYSDVELKGKNKYITLGGGTFIVMWVMVSVLLNTIAH